MTRPIPTERQLAEYCDGLLALRLKVGKKGEQLYAVEQLVQLIRRAYDRDKTGSAIPDGFPRGSSGGGGSPGLPRRTVEEKQWSCAKCGPHPQNTPTYCAAKCGPILGERPQEQMTLVTLQASVEFTSVELAHIDREENAKSYRDHHHELTRQAVDALATSVDALDRLNGLLARIANLIDLNPNEASATKGCRSHERVRDALGRPYFEPVAREDGGRDGLCRWCWGFLKDHEELPSVALLERKIRKGVVTNRDIEETRKRSA